MVKTHHTEQSRRPCHKRAAASLHLVERAGRDARRSVDLHLRTLHGERIDTRNTHGTGCTFSAALAAHLARGENVVAAVAAAKRFVTEALRASYPIGDGHSPVNHFYAVRIDGAPVAALEER